MSVLQHPALTRLWYGGQPPPNFTQSQSQPQSTNLNPNAPAYQPNSTSTSNLNTPTPINTHLAQNVPERSHSPHSVDGSIVNTRRKNRARRGTENSLPVTFNLADISGDIGDDFRKESHTLARKDNFGTEIKRGQAKLDSKADYQVPFPQVQDMAGAANGGSKARRTGAPQPITSNEQRDWEREQALRSPTLSAHSNTSSSHTTAPTSVSTGNTTANSAGASAITIPGSYDTGSANNSGAEVTPTRENSKPKRGSGGTTAAVAGNTIGGVGVNNTSAPTGFTNQQLAQNLPSAPSPRHTLQQQTGYRASPPPLPPAGSPQARTVPGGSPSQPPRQAYAPPPPPPTMASTGPTSSSGSEAAPSLTSRPSYTTIGTTNSLPTLPDSPPSPDPTRLADLIRSPPLYPQQQLGQHVPISPLHPRPTNRTQAGVLGPTKMAESWTAAPPPEELDDEVRERMAHLSGARDGAGQRDRGHRGTGGGSMDAKDGSWVQVQAPERQGSIRRPKPGSQTSTTSVPPVHTQPQVAPAMNRTATVPIAMRYETMSPPPIRDPQAGLHLDFQDNRSIPEKPAPAPAPSRHPGRGPSPVPRQSPNDPRGRETTRAPGTTPPYTYEDQTYGRNRSSSHNTYTTTQPKAAPPPPVTQNQWAGRAPGTGIVPFNEDLDHDEHEPQPAPPMIQQQPMLQSGKSEQSIVDWANHTNSQHPLTHPNQPQPVPPGLVIPPAPPAAPAAERGRGRSRSRGRGDQSQVQAPLMDPAAMYSQQQQQPQPQAQPQNVVKSPEARAGGRSPVPAPVAARGSAGSGSSEAEDLKTPRSPSVPLPNDGYPRFGYGQFSVGHPGTINHIYTQDMGPQNGQMYPSMGFAQSQYALQQMGAGPQGMMGQMNGYHMNGRQVNGRDAHGYNQNQNQNQNGYYGYPQDLSSSASGSFLDGWTSNQMDGRGYPNHARPSAPVPPTPSTTSAPSAISGEIRNGTQGHIARAQTVLYNAQSQLHPQQAYQQPFNYAQAQMSYAMDPYRAPSVVSSFMATPPTHNPFLPPVAEPQSTQSSPSHQPVGLPYGPGLAPKRFGGARMGTKSMGRRRRAMEEFRPESTVPNDTASEAETEGKSARREAAETEFETETEMEEVWLEESDDDELENEFHTTYYLNPAKRKRRFEQKWEQMVKLFREIDRETDATMILAAAPPDQHQTHLLLSRSILRDTDYSHTAQEARAIFSDISIARRRERADQLRRARQERQRKKIIDDRLNQIMIQNQERAAQGALERSGGVGSGSDETSMPQPQTDEDLRLALDKAVNSLQEMRRVFEDMETRHREETNRRKEESLSIEKLLTTLLANKTISTQPSS
ncbi:hypothetical protein RhiJN_00229 [Ceratobasidium sp. AG-Ba]|nr:hypothetical protein RhiJN_00229 [Ceratobasidium sp. AG-Ba]